MLSLKVIFLSCETTICWRKMQITEQLSLNETSEKIKAKANTVYAKSTRVWALHKPFALEVT